MITNELSNVYMLSEENFADYKYLTLHLSGRAKESLHYQRAMYRLHEMESE